MHRKNAVLHAAEDNDIFCVRLDRQFLRDEHQLLALAVCVLGGGEPSQILRLLDEPKRVNRLVDLHIAAGNVGGVKHHIIARQHNIAERIEYVLCCLLKYRPHQTRLSSRVDPPPNEQPSAANIS